jgi:hypothetical protein
MRKCQINLKIVVSGLRQFTQHSYDKVGNLELNDSKAVSFPLKIKLFSRSRINKGWGEHAHQP